MFTLHGRQVRCGIKPATLPYTPVMPPASLYIPFPSIQSVSLTLPAGLQNIIQIGVMPLRDVIIITVENPVDVTVSCLLDEAYPYYPQLFSLLTKDTLTKHFPLVDMRIFLGQVFHNNATPTIELRCGVTRGLNIRADEGAAILELQFTFPIGYLVPNAGAENAPPVWVATTPPARKIFMICTATNKYGDNILGDTAAAVASMSLSTQLSNSFMQTMPNISQAISGTSPILPTSIYAIVNEGAVSYSGNLTLLLPPPIEVVPVTTPSVDITVSFSTPSGLTLTLGDAKIQQTSPTISVGARQQFALSFWAKRLIINTGG